MNPHLRGVRVEKPPQFTRPRFESRSPRPQRVLASRVARSRGTVDGYIILHTLTTPEPAYVFSPISLPYPHPLDPRDRRLTTTVARKLDFDEAKPVTAKPQ
uniref:Uncharacterized protein n=1 Tax=Timema shepardi TaxID=629360 RepID=A0A7R9G3C2_TIMSH|nr:unnamed protein product [Timema shepardi]